MIDILVSCRLTELCGYAVSKLNGGDPFLCSSGPVYIFRRLYPSNLPFSYRYWPLAARWRPITADISVELLSSAVLGNCRLLVLQGYLSFLLLFLSLHPLTGCMDERGHNILSSYRMKFAVSI